MDTTDIPKEIARIKLRARWIELQHWKKLGLRLLWKSILFNCQGGHRKIDYQVGRK